MKRLWLAWDWDGECAMFTGSRPILDDGVWASSDLNSVLYYLDELNSREQAEQCVELVAKEEQ